MRTLTTGVLAVTAATAVACGPIPGLPGPLPSDFAPTATPTAETGPSTLSAEGVLAAQQLAIQVRNTGCPTPRVQSGFVLDDHTIVMGSQGARDSRDFDITASDGTVTTVTANDSAVFGSIAIVGFEESLAGAGVHADMSLTVGDAVTVAGYPGGGRLTTITGVVTGDALDLTGQVGTLTTTSVDVIEPLPGAAVLTTDGEIVGVVYGMDAQGRATIVTLDALLELAGDPRVAIPEAPACS